jgi:hypothetical protein
MKKCPQYDVSWPLVDLVGLVSSQFGIKDRGQVCALDSVVKATETIEHEFIG